MKHTVKCPYDAQYTLNVEITEPGKAKISEKGGTNVYDVSWDPKKYPSSIDISSGFRITPHKVRFFGEKLLDTFKVALELIRQGHIK
jgi:hypothetical protein